MKPLDTHTAALTWGKYAAHKGFIWCANADDTVIVREDDVGGFEVREAGKLHRSSFTFDDAVYHAERLIRIHHPNLYRTA
jgi:hypothetical protein